LYNVCCLKEKVLRKIRVVARALFGYLRDIECLAKLIMKIMILFYLNSMSLWWPSSDV